MHIAHRSNGPLEMKIWFLNNNFEIIYMAVPEKKRNYPLVKWQV